ncbi:MAG: hypothetical protein EON58_15870 [Alphaproteobacteria bacterium]|nr:MAG: hypothetical protein EON58_15870 [Alphaproteobacteria bacterium]
MHGIEMDLTQIDVSNIMNGLQQILGVIQSGDDVRKGERLDIPLEKGGGYFNVAEWTGSGTFFLRNNYGDTEYLVADADSLQSLLSAFRKIQTVLESNH